MSVEVDFVTLGQASKKLVVPAPTLRLWTDELEKNEVHYVMRNQRDERIYYDNDLEIFTHMKKLKDEFGRKAQTKDIALMIYQNATEHDMFDLRTKEDAPKPKPTNTALALLNNDDVQRLLESDRVRQLLGYMVAEATKNIKDELIVEVRKSVRDEMLNGRINIESMLEKNEAKREKEEGERVERMDKALRERDERSSKMLEELLKAKQEQNEQVASKSFWQRLKGQ